MTLGGQAIQGPLVGINKVGDLVSKVLEFLIPLGGIALLIVIIWGGYDFMMSRGTPEKLKSAQAKITAGIIGFVLLAVSFLLIKLIEKIFGLE
ncbi:hypothetical protein HY041_02030, partial [Candidatus Roizmanbacteria bacterium]|nr:hypothetical protein [Candidatus Roizmanbacteria bacterium]